jgi:predicted glycogen debranching enzyme
LLTAATKPPVGRLVLLSKLEETLIIDGRRYELSANQYPGVVHPEGFQYQTGFRLDPFPVFTYEVEGVRLEKRMFMVQGENTTVVQYEVPARPEGRTAVAIVLEVRPLIAFRDYHGTTHENGSLNSNVETQDGLTTLKPYSDLPALHLAHDTARIDVNGSWYRNFQYAVEQERGLDFAEDLFNPCALTFDLNASASISIIASTERRDVSKANAYRKAELERRELLSGEAAQAKVIQLVNNLTSAADQFIVARERCKTVIAGYHWFSDWGRDTMIALPGLTLATGHRRSQRASWLSSRITSIRECCQIVFRMQEKHLSTTQSMRRCGSLKPCVRFCNTQMTTNLSGEISTPFCPISSTGI